MNRVTIEDCRLIDLPKLNATFGHISVVDGMDQVPFKVKRVFYLYDIPAGESRGAHAHKECHQLLVAITGAFEVEMFDGTNKKLVRLDQPFNALHIPPGIWASEQNFSSGAICLVLASEKYLESDYIRSLDDFLKYKNG